MMGWTDRHARYFYRVLSKHTLLYTEMVKDAALIHNQQFIGEQRRLLAHHENEYPLAIQLGGNNPDSLAECASMSEDAGFDEVNLNVGCPSDRVQSGAFGACLMASPKIVAECVSAMQAKVKIPVTVKCRVGIDDMDGYDAMYQFIETVADAGCDTFIVHARKAWLQGLSPKDNREVPPLKYDYVYRLKEQRPDLSIVINGGIKLKSDMHEHIASLDGVMIGREAYYNPYLLASVDNEFYKDDAVIMKTRKQVVDQMLPYIEAELATGCPLHSITRHMLGLFSGCRGAKHWRRTMSEETHHLENGDVAAGLALLHKAVDCIDEDDIAENWNQKQTQVASDESSSDETLSRI